MNKTPKDLFQQYVCTCYNGPLHPQQEKEVSNAFYAGIESVFKLVDDIPTDENDELTTAKLNLFRQLNRVTAMGQNIPGET